MISEAKTKAISKLYERVANGEELSEKEYAFIENYEKQYLIEEKIKLKNSRPNTIDTIFKYGKKVADMIDKVFPNEPKS